MSAGENGSYVPLRALVYAANDAYAPLAGVSLLSYLRHNPVSDDLTVVVLDDGITDTNKNYLKQIADAFHCCILFRDLRCVLDELTAGKVTGYESVSEHGLTTYGRLFFDMFLPDSVRRVLYLDCDTLVAGDVSSLWYFDLEGRPVGLACDCLRNEYKRVIGFPLAERYFNVGVMLMDRARWCACGCTERTLKHLRDVRADYPLADQDLLNLTLRGQIAVLPPCFNFLSQLFLYRYPSYEKVYHLTASNWYDADTFQTARTNPLIYHFCGQTFGRLWFSNSRHPCKEVYDRVVAASPWRNRPGKPVRLSVPYRVQLVAYRFLPECLATEIGAAMQKIFLWKEYHVSS